MLPAVARIRRRFRVRGIVQGVGFRPFVYHLATRLGLSGWVQNDGEGVVAEVEGPPAQVEAFAAALVAEAPPLAVIAAVESAGVPCREETGFAIRASDGAGSRTVFLSPDVATCPACLRELLDPGDRRYRYPFLNCTDCGPRFTIIRDVPYDRERTTMAAFAMCPACRREYEDPADRRFHAQPTACPDCGPRLSLRDPAGLAVAAADPVEAAARALREGAILAVKGMGGYHLACRAADGAAVARLRARKGRPGKPFALMAPDLEAVRALCHLTPEEEQLLTSPRAPIVLLRAREPLAVAPEVAPGQRYLGVMLPYTPLHHLLLREVGEVLVMTSANRSEEPIAYRDEEARERLAGLADLFLVHDREIHMRCDDSVAMVVRGRPLAVRRARGYVPQPVPLPAPVPVPLLAVGGHLKNTFALVRDGWAFLSHHIGDLDNAEAYQSFVAAIAHFRRILAIEPQAVACDLHPDYPSTRWAEETGLPLVRVQHHHAHVAAALAEHGAAGPAIGIALDGTGYGPDGTVWGGELLVADRLRYRRVGHLAPFRLPGGDRAVREPWRVAAALLVQALGPDAVDPALPAFAGVPAGRLGPVVQMAASGWLSPVTTSAGRLFDGFAALAGVHAGPVTYEGEAAIALEMAATGAGEEGAYPFGLEEEGGRLVLRWEPALAALLEDVRRGVAPEGAAARFHSGLARALRAACRRLRQETGLRLVALGGGVFQNRLLLDRLWRWLEADGFTVLVPGQVPPGDGGLAYGQAAVAGARLAAGEGIEDGKLYDGITPDA